MELPADHPRLGAAGFCRGLVKLALDERLTAGLKDVGRRHGVTLNMALLAAWGVLLSRLSGQGDVVIGTPTANRRRLEVEGLIGFFVNTLAVRLELSGSPTVSELLGQAREQVLAAQQHEDIPFEQVVDLLNPVRSLSHSPLFQVMFGWQNNEGGGLELEGIGVVALPAPPHRVARFDLTVSLRESGGGIAGVVEHATSLFEGATIERYLGYFRNLLEAMVADDTQAVNRLGMLPGWERERVLYEWNETEGEYPREKCVHELLEEQAGKTPEAVAVVCGEEELSYGELNRRANQLAHYLRELGVKPEERVGICVERSVEMVVGVVGVLKAGGAYVPLDPGYPAERLRYMIEDSAPVVLLTQGHLEKWWAGMGDSVRVLDLGSASPPWREHAESSPARDGIGADPQHLAYVIYTSGSTGTPKGVMVTHRNVVGLVRNTSYVDFAPLLTIGHLSNPAFDAATFEVWGALLNGCRLAVIPRFDVLEPEKLAMQLQNLAGFYPFPDHCPV